MIASTLVLLRTFPPLTQWLSTPDQRTLIAYVEDSPIDTLEFNSEQWTLLEDYLNQYEQYYTYRKDLYTTEPQYVKLLKSFRPANHLQPVFHAVSIATDRDTVTGVILARSGNNVIVGRSQELYESLDGLPSRDFNFVPFSDIASLQCSNRGCLRAGSQLRTTLSPKAS